MADTQPLAPTDAEILEAVKHLGAAMLSPIEVARTVLAKWGTPQPAPDCHHRPPCDECAALAAQGGKE